MLVTRPEPGASATAARLKALGHAVLVLPLSEAVPIAWEPPPGPFEAVFFTSAQAPRLGGAGLAGFRHLPAWCVGAATAEAARAAGFDAVRSAPVRGGQELVDALAAAGVCAALHLCGAHAGAPKAPPGLRIERRVVYAAAARDWNAAECMQARRAVLALAYSPRGAARLAEALGKPARRRIRLAALSDAVAACGGDGWRAVAVAERPDEHALFAAAALLCEKRAR